MKFGLWTFTPGLWPSVATLIVVPFLASLGMWQLDRAGQKRELHSTYIQRQQAAPVDLNREIILRQDEQKILWHRVSAFGQFDESVQVLLDNQVKNNQAGYFVFTPFQLEGSDSWFLVNRGWLSAGLDRNKLPEFMHSNGLLQITGVVKHAQGTGILLGGKTEEELVPGIYRVNRIELPRLEKQLGRSLMPYVIRLDRESPSGYLREWSQPGSDENMHLGYAFQWFALTGMVLIIYIVLNLKKTDE